VLAWSLLAYACSVEDENPGSTRPRGAEAGPGIEPGSSSGDTPPGAPLCGKYGGYTEVKKIAAEIVTHVAQDCRISAPIANLQPGRETQHFNECFEIFIGSTFQCPEAVYVANQTRDSAGERCRSMTQAHQGYNLRTADFNAFVGAIGAGLRAKNVSEEDIRLLAPSFEGTRTGVVQTNNQPTKNTHCTCPGGLYMGQSCTVIVDAGIDVNDSGNPQDSGDSG
jgi:hypothetical protein